MRTAHIFWKWTLDPRFRLKRRWPRTRGPLACIVAVPNTFETDLDGTVVTLGFDVTTMLIAAFV